MHGYNVFLPIGFDAFGLPAENAAIKNRHATRAPGRWPTSRTMRRQLRTMGATFAWDAEVVTVRPRRTTAGTSGCSCGSSRRAWRTARSLAGRLVPQRRHAGPRAGRGHGPPLLALRREGREARSRPVVPAASRSTPTSCSTSPASTGPSRSRSMQTNWIGRSRGRRDRLHGRRDAAPPGRRGDPRLHDPPGHAVRRDVHGPRARARARRGPDRAGAARRGRGVRRAAAADKTEIDRLSTDREKTGVAIGADAINPVNGERIPIFVADYVLGGYGTGAIMAVPAHDERDFAFAQKFGLPIRRVVAAQATATRTRSLESAYVAHTDRRGHGQQRRVRRPAGRRGRHAIVEWLERATARASRRSRTACATG